MECRDTLTEPRLRQYLYRCEERKIGRKTESLSLEAKTEAKTIEQEEEIVSETVEQKLKPWESKSGEGEGTKPETMKQNVELGDRKL